MICKDKSEDHTIRAFQFRNRAANIERSGVEILPDFKYLAFMLTAMCLVKTFYKFSFLLGFFTRENVTIVIIV